MAVSGFQIIGFGLATFFMFLGVSILAYVPLWIGMKIVKEETKQKKIELEILKFNYRISNNIK